MPGYFGALTLVLLAGLVILRIMLLRRQGIAAFNFGKLDKTDFVIPPFALFYFYCVLAAGLDLPSLSRQVFFQNVIIAWMGVLGCLAGLGLFVWSLVSFGQSFRVGIDTQHPDRLVTSGAFAFSRNPIYVAFLTILVSQFLIFPNWILLVYACGGAWLINRQVRREEGYLKQHYGLEYAQYSRRVRRYV